MLLQVHELEYGEFNSNSNKKSTLFDNDEINTRFENLSEDSSRSLFGSTKETIVVEAPKVLPRCFCLEQR